MPVLNDLIATNVATAGSINDKLIAFFSGIYRGSGSPEGVTDAPLGSTYWDVTTPGVYLKTTATGTLTGWVLFAGSAAGAFQPGIPIIKTGKWYFTPSGAATTTLQVDGAIRTSRWDQPGPKAIDRIGVDVTGQGTAGSVIRLGWYNDDGTNNPGTLLFDAGTVDTTTTGVKTITVAQTIPAGRSWPCSAAQGAPGTSPTIRTTASTTNDATNPAFAQADGWSNHLTRSGVAGALPTPATMTGDGATAPLISFRGA